MQVDYNWDPNYQIIRKNPNEAPEGQDALNINEWREVYLAVEDIKKFAMEMLDAGDLAFHNVKKIVDFCDGNNNGVLIDSHFFEKDGKVFAITRRDLTIKDIEEVVLIRENLDKIFPDGYTQIQASGHHWVAINAEKKNGKLNYKRCDSTKREFDAYDYISPVLQANSHDCGIFATLNAIDMASGSKNKYCTKKNVYIARKWFCETKAKQALKSAKEVLYKKYIVNNNKEWKVMAPPPLPGRQGDSQLIKLLEKKNLTEANSAQKQFLFKYDNSDKTSYIDTKYNHEAVATGDYKLQKTIEAHTKKITDGLIAAYNEVYYPNTADFTKIKEIWRKAQDEEEWRKIRKSYLDEKCTEDDENMLMFSAKFQNIMKDAKLMTGNTNATEFVGMRLKRVSSYHMDALQKQLGTKSVIGNSLKNVEQSQFNEQKTVKEKVQLAKEDCAVESVIPVNEAKVLALAQQINNMDALKKGLGTKSVIGNSLKNVEQSQFNEQKTVKEKVQLAKEDCAVESVIPVNEAKVLALAQQINNMDVDNLDNYINKNPVPSFQINWKFDVALAIAVCKKTGVTHKINKIFENIGDHLALYRDKKTHLCDFYAQLKALSDAKIINPLSTKGLKDTYDYLSNEDGVRKEYLYNTVKYCKQEVACFLKKQSQHII